jgi:heme exporter protein D
MPELGKYAVEVLSAYAIAFVLIGGLIAATLIQGARARRDLSDIEKRKEQSNG